MFSPVPVTPAQQKRQKRALFDQGKEAETHSMKRLFRIRQNTLAADSHPDLVDPIIVTGEALGEFAYTRNQIYVRNITLEDADTGRVILQRFGPPNLTCADKMKEDAQNGINYFDTVEQTADCHQHTAAARQAMPEKPRPQLHFGIWYDQLDKYLELSSETKQVGDEAGKSAVASFCAWFNVFASTYLEPLVEDPESGLCSDFRTELNDRVERQFPWASERIHGLGAMCLPLYSTFTPSRGFSPISHRDHQDADVSILVNLGQHAILELREYNCHLVLQPCDIVFFLANSVHHRTLPHPAHTAANSDPRDRFAIPCYFRQDLKDQKGLKELEELDVVTLTLAAQELQEQGRPRRHRRRRLIEEVDTPETPPTSRLRPRPSAP